jgi:hypothetical protein
MAGNEHGNVVPVAKAGGDNGNIPTLGWLTHLKWGRAKSRRHVTVGNDNQWLFVDTR